MYLKTMLDDHEHKGTRIFWVAPGGFGGFCVAPEERAEYHDARWVAPLSNAVRFALSSRARPGGQVATLACDGCDQDQPARGALRASCASTGEAALLLISFLELLCPLL